MPCGVGVPPGVLLRVETSSSHFAFLSPIQRSTAPPRTSALHNSDSRQLSHRTKSLSRNTARRWISHCASSGADGQALSRTRCRQSTAIPLPSHIIWPCTRQRFHSTAATVDVSTPDESTPWASFDIHQARRVGEAELPLIRHVHGEETEVNASESNDIETIAPKTADEGQISVSTSPKCDTQAGAIEYRQLLRAALVGQNKHSSRLDTLEMDIREELETSDLRPLRTWTALFAPLNSPHNYRLRKEGRALQSPPKELTAEHYDMADILFASGDDRDAVRAQWDTLYGNRARDWPLVLAALLFFRPPERAQTFLLATCQTVQPPPYVVADALERIISIYLRDLARYPQWSVDLHPLFEELLNVLPRVARHLEPSSLDTLLGRHDLQQASKLYKLLNSKEALLWGSTHLTFAARVGSWGHHELSLSALEKAKLMGESTNSEGFAKTCSETLYMRNVRNDPDATPHLHTTAIVEGLLRLGVDLNAVHYTIIMQNAVHGGDLATVLRVFDFITEQGISDDAARLFSVLVQACALTDDPNLREKAVVLARAALRKSKNAYLATEILHLHIAELLKQKRPPTYSQFQSTWNMYEQFFDVQPLLDLGIRPPHKDDAVPAFGSLKMRPPVHALTMMITVFLRTCMSAGRREIRVQQTLYKRYRQLVNEGHPHIAPLAEDCYTHNAFLFAFGSWSWSLHLCPHIMKDMGSPLESSAWHHAAQRAVKPAAPDKWTWSILLRGFVFNNQPVAAEKVLELMQERNITPNAVTWTTLVSGYAGMQDADKAVETLRRMERAGFPMDDWVAKGLGRIVDRERLMKSVEATSWKTVELDGGKRQDAAQHMPHEAASSHEEPQSDLVVRRRLWEDGLHTVR